MEKDRKPEPFQFLTHAEFSALTQEERVKYLDRATKEVKPSDLPSKLFKDD